MIEGLNDMEVILLTPKNVTEHSGNVAEIYRKGYFYDEQLKKGFYPHDFVYFKESIESALLNNPSSLIWSYIKKEGVPICAIIGYLENCELELMGLVNIPEIRKMGYYSELMKQYLSDSILGYFKNSVSRVVAEPQLIAPPVLMHTIFGNASPVGFSPNMRKIGNTNGIARMSLYNMVFYPELFYRKNELDNFSQNFSQRLNNCVIPEVFELADSVCSFINIPSPTMKYARKIPSKNYIIKPSEVIDINSLFFQKRQEFFLSKSNSASVLSNINDNSCFIDLEKFSSAYAFESLMKSILEFNQDKDMLYTRNVPNLSHQKTLFELGFKPVSYIPCGANNGKDSVTFMKLKSFTKNDALIIEDNNNKNLEYLSGIINKFYGKNNGYLSILNQEMKISRIVMKNFQ